MEARRKIAVAGATGRVGHHVVDLLEARGHDVVAISRSTGVVSQNAGSARGAGQGHDHRKGLASGRSTSYCVLNWRARACAIPRSHAEFG